VSEILFEINGQRAQPIVRYPDEPHPDNKWEWQSWWIKRFYSPDDMLTAGDLAFMKMCWLETKARWNVPADNAR